jgi:hypothetical protein
MLFWEIDAVYLENYTKYVNKSAELFDVKIEHSYSDHCDLKSQPTFRNVSPSLCTSRYG